jgi:peptide/nickel transport system substrate-binding protein
MVKGTRLRLSLVTLGAVGVLVLAACGSGGGSDNGLKTNVQGGYGSIPAATGTPTNGGVVTYAEQPGAGPAWIFPINDNAHATVYGDFEFEYLMWRPLYYPTTGASPTVDYSKSVAAAPVYTNDNKTITIKLNPQYKWSDGKPVTANDVLFTLDLSKAAVKENPANLANYTPGEFPDNIVSASAPDQHTVVLNLDKTYNQAWLIPNELDTYLLPLPSADWNISATGGPHLDFATPANAKAIYDYLYKQSETLSTFATNPLWQIVDGQFKIKTYNASTNAVNLAANTAYTGPDKPKIAELDELAYTSTEAEWNDVLSGKLDVAYVDPADIPQLSKATKLGYNFYGLPSTGFSYMYFNFKDATGSFNKIIGQLYVRQALAHLQNEEAVIKGAFKGAAVPQYSTIGTLPTSAYSQDAISTPIYGYDVNAAKNLFTSHGWQTQGGVLTCESAGTGPKDCGDGIAKGTPLTFSFYYINSQVFISQQVDAFASAAKQLGINITLKSFTFNQLLTVANDPGSASTENDWGMADFGGFTGVLYPTGDGIFNTTGTYNEGGYSDPQADSLIHSSVFGTDTNALVKESTYLGKNLPAIFQPNPDDIWVWKKNIQGPSNSWSSLTQFWLNPEDWYVTK